MADNARPHETRDVMARPLLVFAGGLVLFLVVALVLLRLTFGAEPPWQPEGRAAQANAASPALQRDPRGDHKAFAARQRRAFEELAWVDREKGIARIPVEEAMAIIAERGLPRFGDQVRKRAGKDCARLADAVPRAPQAAKCREDRP